MKIRSPLICCFGLVLVSVLLDSCTSGSPGVETGNPQIKVRQVVGEIDGETLDNPLSFLVTDDLASYRMTGLGCDGNIDEVEARPLDLSDSVTAAVTDLMFSIEIDQEKSYTFVTKSGGNYCGVLFYNPLTFDYCDDPQRVVVLAGESDVSFGLMGMYSDGNFKVASMPYAATDTDEDGIVDLYDEDINDDGVTDFDGNYDGYIDLANAADTGVLGECDVSDMRGTTTSLRGTVEVDDGTAEVVLSGTTNFESFSLAGIEVYDVDEANDLVVSDIAAISLSGNEATLSLDVSVGHDFLLTVPLGSFSCAGGQIQERALTYYFRAVDYNVNYSCGN